VKALLVAASLWFGTIAALETHSLVIEAAAVFDRA
jgi:hypothetical protein